MVTFTFLEPDGTRKSVSASEGETVMQIAIAQGIKGITAECGGALACATCHVFVDAAHLEKVKGVTPHEDEMLDFAAVVRRPESRLSCQILVTQELEAAVITIPETQI